jgi:uncharacterized membrane protein
MIALCGFMALAIDVGMLTIAKTQAQNAADLAALTAARTLNGSSAVSTYNNVPQRMPRPSWRTTRSSRSKFNRPS